MTVRKPTRGWLVLVAEISAAFLTVASQSSLLSIKTRQVACRIEHVSNCIQDECHGKSEIKGCDAKNRKTESQGICCQENANNNWKNRMNVSFE